MHQHTRLGIAANTSKALRAAMARGARPRRRGLQRQIDGAAHLGLALEPASIITATRDVVNGDGFDLMQPLMAADVSGAIDSMLPTCSTTFGPGPVSMPYIEMLENIQAEHLDDAGHLGKLISANLTETLLLELEYRSTVAITRAGALALEYHTEHGEWPAHDRYFETSAVAEWPMSVEILDGDLILRIERARRPALHSRLGKREGFFDEWRIAPPR